MTVILSYENDYRHNNFYLSGISLFGHRNINPTTLLNVYLIPGLEAPFSMPAACFRKYETGGVVVSNE